MRACHNKNTWEWILSHGCKLWITAALWSFTVCGMAEVLKPDEVMFAEIVWFPINADEVFPTPPQDLGLLNQVGIASIEINPARGEVSLNLGNASDNVQHMDLWYADQNQEGDDFSSLKWQMMAENLEVDPWHVLSLIDSGEKTGTPPQNVFRRFYLLRPAGLESSPVTIDNGQDETIHQDALPGVEDQNSSVVPTMIEPTRGELEAFTMEDAEKFVADEHASGVEYDRNATRSLMAAYARKAWQVEREGVLIVARELNEAPVTTAEHPEIPYSVSSALGESQKEQRVEMVFARIHAGGSSQVTGRDAHGEESTWNTERDFRLLEGVRVFAYNDIYWTVFVLTIPAPDDETIPNGPPGPPPDGVFAALSEYYDAHHEQLEMEQARNELIREAREVWKEQHVPSRPVRVLNFWRMEAVR